MNFLTSFLTDKVKDYAISSWRKYSFKQEWLSVILLVLTVKIATSAVSIFSGYYYLTDVFSGLFGSETLQKTFSIISLILIELLNALFLAKAFKFILRLDNLKWIFPMCLSIGLFTLSFITSTNGIAVYMADKVDLRDNINQKYQTQLDAIRAETAANVDLCKQQIENIKSNPTDWKDGKRCILSAGQLCQINKIYDKITELQKCNDVKISELTLQKNIELSDNQAVTKNTSNRYYKYVAVIMAIQTICSFLLWFFWCKISGEEDTENAERETIETSLDNVLQTVDNCISKRIDNRISTLNTIYGGIAAETGKNTAIVAADTTETPEDTPKRPPLKVVGFGTNTARPKTPENEPIKEEGTANVPNVHGTPENAAHGLKTCLCCGNALTPSQIVRHAKFCSPKCRIFTYNKEHPERKPISIKNAELS